MTKQCKQLEIALTDGDDCDIDGAMLADELDSFKSLIPSMAGRNPRELLQYMHKHKLCDASPKPLHCYTEAHCEGFQGFKELNELAWPMCENTRFKYSNRAVTYSSHSLPHFETTK